MTLTLVQIPALGCDAGLYSEFNSHLDCRTQTIVAIANTMGACVEQVLANAPEEFLLLGTSFGGRVAMEAALTAPKRVKMLVIIGAEPGAAADPAAGSRRSMRARSGEFESVVSEMCAKIAHMPGPSGPSTAETTKAMCQDMGEENFALQSDALTNRSNIWPRMKEIACPVFCLWGRQDQFSSFEVGEQIASVVPVAKLVVFEDCGHFPTLEYPGEAARVVGGWLAAHASRPR